MADVLSFPTPPQRSTFAEIEPHLRGMLEQAGCADVMVTWIIRDLQPRWLAIFREEPLLQVNMTLCERCALLVEPTLTDVVATFHAQSSRVITALLTMEVELYRALYPTPGPGTKKRVALG